MSFNLRSREFFVAFFLLLLWGVCVCSGGGVSTVVSCGVFRASFPFHAVVSE